MGAGTPAAGIPATFSLRQGILCVSVSQAWYSGRVVNLHLRGYLGDATLRLKRMRQGGMLQKS